MTEFLKCPSCEKKTGTKAYRCKSCDNICCEKCGDKYCPKCTAKFSGGGFFSSGNYEYVGTVRS